MIGGEADRALLGLAGGDAIGARLEAVVGRVAHHVGERVLDALQHLAVELGVGAVHLELDVLAELGREIAHDARQLLPGIADRLHARLHDAFLQLGGDVGEPLQRHLEIGIVVPAHDVEKLIARQHQLRNHRHQVFERVEVDADRLLRGLGLRAAPRPSALGLGRRRAWPARGLAGATGFAGAGPGVSRNTRSSSSSETSPGTQRPFQHLRHQRADVRCGRRDGRVREQRRRSVIAIPERRSDRRRRPSGSRSFLSSAERMSLMRSIAESTSVTASPVTGSAVAEFAHQGFGGVRQRLQPRQTEEAAGAFDGVDQTEDVAEDLRRCWAPARNAPARRRPCRDFRWSRSGIPAAGRPLQQPSPGGPAPSGRPREGQCVVEAFNFSCERTGAQGPLIAR